jgi:D-amino-acid dehydrogenase
MTQAAPEPSKTAIVIGAGIVGVCCAVYLQRAGFRVTLVERDEPGRACSFGNAGNIGSSSFMPYSTPGIARRIPKLLLDPRAALKVRAARALASLPWFLRFIRAGAAERLPAIIEARKAILTRALDAYEPILREARGRDVIETKGKLMLFESEEQFQTVQADLRARREGGARVDILTADEVRQLQPGLSPGIVKGAFLPDLSHCVNPLRLTRLLVEHFLARGGDLLTAEVKAFEPRADGPPRIVTDRATLAAQHVVLAAGIWSKALAKQLGVRVPIESQRGYHAMLAAPGVDIRIPLMANARNILVTPMAEGLRCTGIAEHAGIAAEPNYALADLVLDHARDLIPGLRTEKLSRWMGQRPSTPDSLPVIGRSPRHRDVLFAFGHGHTGLTMGAITGKLVAELAAAQPTTIDVAPYRPDRF